MNDFKPAWASSADPEMVEWCERLNAIPGVETLQSCAGHKEGERSVANDSYPKASQGHLWLRIDRPFNPHQLAANPLFSRVAAVYEPEPGRYFWELIFRGNESGLLQDSMWVLEKALA